MSIEYINAVDRVTVTDNDGDTAYVEKAIHAEDGAAYISTDDETTGAYLTADEADAFGHHLLALAAMWRARNGA